MTDKDRDLEREREKLAKRGKHCVGLLVCVCVCILEYFHTFPPSAHIQQHKHTRTEQSNIWSARHKIGSWPSVLPWKPCQMPCCDWPMLNKRRNLVKLVSLYQKWDRKLTSLGNFHSLPSIGYLSSGFCFCLGTWVKKQKYMQRRTRKIVLTPCVTVSNLIPQTI